MSGQVINVVSQSPPSSRCFRFQSSRSQLSYARLTISKTFSCSALVSSLTFRGSCFGSGFSKQRRNWHPLTEKNLEISMGHQVTCLGISLPSQRMSLRFLTPKRETCTKVRWNVRPASRLQGGASASLIFGLFVCFSSSKPAYAEAPKKKDEDDCDSSLVNSSHGKKVYRDYYVTAIPGDGRCLFRSVAHGACIRSGKPPPSESVQRELADELRSRVADEFVKRREETEWFIEGDFDTYVSQIRKPYVWGGEPELFMASHVLQMPITVYMYDEDASGLIAIAEYGQEYGKDDPIRVLYHGYGHYEALQITGKKGGRSRM